MVSAEAAPPAPDELRRMAWSLRHRGPDGFGVYIDDRAGLAHTRLAIIDRTGGHQPMGTPDADLWVAFNGEIFNYVELRAELERAGHRFRSRSDTEVILHAFREWGDDAWERFNGQFAIALRDARDGTIRLVRDRVGIAPLHYALLPGVLVFGSEAKAIFASGRVRASADFSSLAAAFTLWSVPAPSTVFAGVQVVPPGAVMRFDRDFRPHPRVYHSLSFAGREEASNLSTEEAAEQLVELLTRAVKIRLRADVPVGAYLSGGLDSSVVARVVRQADSSPLQTFSLRFADARFDEGEAQLRMARDLGTTHHEIVATPEMVGAWLPKVVRHCEAPLLRTAPVPMFMLSSLVRDNGMRVVLTGEGADEFLGGYDIFKEDKVRRFWARRPDSDSRALLLRRVHRYVANASGPMWQAFFRRGLTDTDDPFYSHRLRWDNNAWTLRFLSPDLRASLDAPALENRIHASLPPGWRDATSLARAQHLEIATFMTPYLLAGQGDRAIMAHGVEGRYPYLDPEVVAFCSRLPSRQKLCGLREKAVLRTAARRLLPRDTAERRKWPYRAPIGPSLFGVGAPEYVRETLSPDRLADCPLIDARAASSLCDRAWSVGGNLAEREEMALVGVLTLCLWHNEFLAGAGASQIDQADGYAVAPLVWVDRRSGYSEGAAGRHAPGARSSTIDATFSHKEGSP